MELVRVVGPLLFQRLFQHIHGGRIRVLVVVAEQAQHRRPKLRNQGHRRDRLPLIERFGGLSDVAAPEVHHGVEGRVAGRRQDRVPAAGAGADDADLAVAAGLRLDPLQRRVGVAEDGRIGDLGAGDGRDLVRRALAEAVEQVRRNRDEPVLCKAPRELPVELIPARHVMQQHNPRIRPRAVRARDVGVDQVPAATRNLRDPGDHAAFCCRVETVPGHPFPPLPAESSAG